jgi:hypothetical protein
MSAWIGFAGRAEQGIMIRPGPIIIKMKRLKRLSKSGLQGQIAERFSLVKGIRSGHLTDKYRALDKHRLMPALNGQIRVSIISVLKCLGSFQIETVRDQLTQIIDRIVQLLFYMDPGRILRQLILYQLV